MHYAALKMTELPINYFVNISIPHRIIRTKVKRHTAEILHTTTDASTLSKACNKSTAEKGEHIPTQQGNSSMPLWKHVHLGTNWLSSR